VILADGRTLAQSNAIILHLAEHSDLTPADGYAQAKMLERLVWEQFSHEPYIAVARFQIRYLGKDPGALEPRFVERGHVARKRLDDAVAGGGLLSASGSASQTSRWSPTRAGRRGRPEPGGLSGATRLDRPDRTGPVGQRSRLNDKFASRARRPSR
jgi:hypothetical protein